MNGFRLARPEDAHAIYRIAQSVAHGWKGTNSGGFLLSRYSEEDYLQRAKQKEIFLTGEGEIRGYVILIPFESPTLETIRGYLAQVQDRYVDFTNIPNLLWLDQVAVGADFVHQGVGSVLYRDMFALFPNIPFLTAIAEKPDHNQPSLDFHKKYGFSRIGTFQADNFFGVAHYQSGIFLRP